MMDALHSIDPDGDTIITLSNPNAPFAIWDRRDKWPAAPYAKETANAWQTPYITTPQGKSKREQDEKAQGSTATEAPDPGVLLRVSSRHLILASPYFKNMLTGPWKETQQDSKLGYAVHAEDWDQQAFLILMNVIHGRNRRVPRILGLELLAKISVLVDYYQCHEAVESFSEGWIDGLNMASIFSARLFDPIVPYKSWVYDRNLVLRVFVAWVFDEADVFECLMKTALDSATGPFYCLDLPIPQAVTGMFYCEVPTRFAHHGLSLTKTD